jgi:hypothetical protein
MDVQLHETQETVRVAIQGCQGARHDQQVAYSTYHNALTQICWTERIVRTNSRDLVGAAA